MANTPHGYPYPLGTDRLMDGDDVIHSLATAVDTQLGVLASGSTPITATALNATASAVITLPASRFTAPIPSVTTQAANPSQWSVGVSAVGAASFTINLVRLSGAVPATTTVFWTAHQI